MRRLIKHSESWEGFRPPADQEVFALRTRLANETEDKKHAPRWVLVFAVCFALGVWQAVLFMAVAPGPAAQFVRWSETAIAHWSGSAKTTLQQPSAQASAAPHNCDKARRGRAPNACGSLPLRSSLR